MSLRYGGSRHRLGAAFVVAGLLLVATGSCRRQSATAQPAASPAALRTSPAPVHADARTEAVSAHLLLTGSYEVNRQVLAVCAIYPEHARRDLQISFEDAPHPQVVLLLKGFHGAGAYTAEARVRASYTGETSLQSKGVAHARLTVQPVAQPRPGSLISGMFSAAYFGEAGKGGVWASFERCFYGGEIGS
jgi:hypothetical protein